LDEQRYSVELRFIGISVDVDRFTAEMGVAPSSWSNGTEKSKNSRPRKPFWSYDGNDLAGFKESWLDLAEGLDFLTCGLLPYQKKIDFLSNDCECQWWCGKFINGWESADILPSILISRIAEYKIPLYLNTYFSN